MLKVLLRLLFLVLYTNSINSQSNYDEILFAGHAYGSHKEIDNFLDGNLISHFNENDYSKLILGGDFIYDCNSQVELNNFKNFYLNNSVELVIGNHDNCDPIFELSIKSKNYYYELINNTLIFYLNTSKENVSETDSIVEYVDNLITEKAPQNVIIFTHQLIFSKSDWFIRVNSRKFYDFGNKLYQKFYDKYHNQKLPFYFIAGDIGAFDYTPYAFYHKDNNFNLLASGLGNNFHSKAIRIIIDSNVNLDFVDLKSGNFENLNKYSKLKVQLYQFPKLILFIIKSNYLLVFSMFLSFILVYLLSILVKKYVKK